MYDPVYQHEYYMKHRQLKGRRRSQKQDDITQRVSSKGLTKESIAELKEYWQMLKDRLADEKERINEAKKETIEKLNNDIMNKIDDLKSRIKAASTKEAKAALREEVAELRQTKKDTRSQIVSISRSMYTKVRDRANKLYNTKVSDLKAADAAKPKKTKKTKKEG